jgi:hypothetical protein
MVAIPRKHRAAGLDEWHARFGTLWLQYLAALQSQPLRTKVCFSSLSCHRHKAACDQARQAGRGCVHLQAVTSALVFAVSDVFAQFIADQDFSITRNVLVAVPCFFQTFCSAVTFSQWSVCSTLAGVLEHCIPLSNDTNAPSCCITGMGRSLGWSKCPCLAGVYALGVAQHRLIDRLVEGVICT